MYTFLELPAKWPSAKATPFISLSSSQGRSGQSCRWSLFRVCHPQTDSSCCLQLRPPDSHWHPRSVMTLLGAGFEFPLKQGLDNGEIAFSCTVPGLKAVVGGLLHWEAPRCQYPGPASRKCSWPCPHDPKKALAAPSTWLHISTHQRPREGRESLSCFLL